MDLRRRQIGRRRLADPLGVDGGAVGVAGERAVGRRLGQVLVGDEGTQPAHGRQHVVGDAAPRARLQRGRAPPRGCRCRGGRRARRTGPVGRRAQLPIELREDAVEHRSRRHPAERHAFAQERELLVEPARIRGQARQDLLGVALRRDRTRAQELRQRALEAAQRAEREATKADEALHAQPLLALVDEDVERDLVGGRQAIAGDGLRRGELAPGTRVIGGFALARGVEELVAVAVVADVGRPLGVAAHRRLPRVVEERLHLARRNRIDRLGGSVDRADQPEARRDGARDGLDLLSSHASSPGRRNADGPRR